jgi:hypothetical protein
MPPLELVLDPDIAGTSEMRQMSLKRPSIDILCKCFEESVLLTKGSLQGRNLDAVSLFDPQGDNDTIDS